LKASGADVSEPEQPERRRVLGRRLTDKQALVLELVSEGLENKEIGHRMGLSEQAVKEHVSTLLHRLAVRNRAALAEIATELKIVGTTELDPEWLNYIFKRSPVMTAIVRGPDHVFVAVNAAYADASGTTEGLVGRSFRDVFPAGAIEILDEVYATGKPQLLHNFRGRWGRQPDEDDGYAEVTLQPLPGPEGVAGISILAVDMTDAVRARQKLVELSEEELALLDLIPSAIIVLDRRGAIVKVNRAAKALLGDGPFAAVSSESAKPYRLRDATTGREFRSVDETLERALAGETFRDLRIRMFLPARGRDASLRVDAEPLRAPDGAVRAVVAALTELENSAPA
jgi:PAS domain S-box-containing protein